MKKYMSLMLALLMLAALFTGCAQKTAESAPAVTDAPKAEEKAARKAAKAAAKAAKAQKDSE